MKPWDVVIVGGGAAGLLAAARAARRRPATLLLEKNSKLGVKILMSGGTRCNLTHATDAQGIATAFCKRQGNFLRSPLSALGPEQLVELVEAEGVATKIEKTGKVFPVSNKANDVLHAFRSMVARTSCTTSLDEAVLDIEHRDNRFLLKTAKRDIESTRVIITVGGKSYPGCGTTGDGYAWAERLGHRIEMPRPALVPITLRDAWLTELTGIAVEDTMLTALTNGKKPPPEHRCRDALLMTHFGLSGPAPMNISKAFTSADEVSERKIVCDFLPATSEHDLAELFRSSGSKAIVNLIPELLPRRLRESIMLDAQVPLETTSANLTKPQRNRLVTALKQNQLRVAGTRGFKKAEVTAGGVCLKEVDSRTMQSKLVPNLYFAGEILDIDGPIGGYNFQAAFSTGWLAGESV